jgi:hypothetical protein
MLSEFCKRPLLSPSTGIPGEGWAGGHAHRLAPSPTLSPRTGRADQTTTGGAMLEIPPQ